MTRRPRFSYLCDGRLSACCCVRLDFASIFLIRRDEARNARAASSCLAYLGMPRSEPRFESEHKWRKTQSSAPLRRFCLCRPIARNQITNTLRLTERLEGEAVGIPATSWHIADDVIRFRSTNNATPIVVGKSCTLAA
jgi:hypothetical protein